MSRLSLKAPVARMSVRRSLFRRAAVSVAVLGLAVSGAASMPLWATLPYSKTEKLPPPSQIVAEAPASEWVSIAPSDIVVMQLAPDGKAPSTRSGKRRVVIQLMPAPFSQWWVSNIRTLVAAHWYDGVSVNRVQDNYVVQWGDADGENTAKAKALPEGLVSVGEDGYETAVNKTHIPFIWELSGKQAIPFDSEAYYESWSLGQEIQPSFTDPYNYYYSFYGGMPVGVDEVITMPPDTEEIPAPPNKLSNPNKAWPVHCYGMVGVGRNLSPDTGTGAELYVVIGHAPRHLDRNIALVGRVIEGIEHLSSLPRGTGPLGFYENAEERVPIVSVRMGDETPDLPAYEYLDTNGDSFADYAYSRANRQDAFFIRPAGGADICNIPVPVRRKPL